MNVFISYGHDRTKLVSRIAEDLKKLGHDIWMDIDRLNSGMDWRNEIAEAILKCQAVLVFMSAYSLRSGGVCLDEINIAAVCSRKVIRPIITEKGIESLIPAVINGIQYFDFSDWESFFTDDALYREKINLLVDELKIMEKDPYAKQMETICTALRPSILNSRLLTELEKPYCVRKWLDAYIIERIHSKDSSLLLLVGFPGFGKSCYCSHYFQSFPEAVSLVFCEWGKNTFNNAKLVIRNIAYQIASRITSFRNRLLWILNSVPISIASMSEFELFDLLITEPFMYELGGQHAPILIILDGLDEATSDNENMLAQIIADKHAALPGYVHFLITSRNDPMVLCHYTGEQFLELKPGDEHLKGDILTFLKEQLGEFEGSVSLEELTSVCNGSFLLAYLIVKGIKDGGIQINSKHYIPNNIHAIYYRWMSRIVSADEYEEHYWDVFSVLSSLKSPVTISLLQYVMDWKRNDMLRFTRRFHHFLIEETNPFGEKCLSLFHRTFCDWLTDESAGVFFADPDEGSDILAKGALKAMEDGRLNNGDLVHLWEYVKASGQKTLRQKLAADDNFFEKLIGLAEERKDNRNFYQAFDRIIVICREICSERSVSEKTTYFGEVRLPLVEASGMFCAGDYFGTDQILSAHMSSIDRLGNDKEIMQALYLCGASEDYLGKRADSVASYERLLAMSEKLGDIYYRKRALAGLAWNSHFSDITRVENLLKELAELPFDTDVEYIIHHLLYARALLSRGELSRALEIFSEIMNTSSDVVWGYDRASERIQMLMIEAIVACYDNEMFDRGIEYGLSIYEHLFGSGTLAECYCASWIAMNEIMDGRYDEARAYLQRADEINGSANSSPRSQWIVMHLRSVRAFLLAECGETDEAVRRHQEIAKLAKECNDPWVEGDACFEIAAAFLLNRNDCSELARHAASTLRDAANNSGLPHLRFKSRIIDASLSDQTDVEELRELCAQITENKLPSTDMVLSGYLCWRLAVRCGNHDITQTLASQIMKMTEDFCRNNPNGQYRNRRLIRMIMSEISN